MFKKIFIKLFRKPCDHCGERKWDMIIERRKSYRGTIVKRTCQDCKKMMERDRLERIVLKPIDEDTRRMWF